MILTQMGNPFLVLGSMLDRNPNNYELKLPLQMKIHLVFHVMYLEPANNNTLLKINLSRINLDNQKIEYEVEAILD